MSGSKFDFTEVDHSRPEDLVGYLDSVRAADQTAEMKRRSIDALQLSAGDAVLDVGCGTGEDVAAMAERVVPGGRAVGVDLSVAMIEEARAGTAGLATCISKLQTRWPCRSATVNFRPFVRSACSSTFPSLTRH